MTERRRGVQTAPVSGLLLAALTAARCHHCAHFDRTLHPLGRPRSLSGRWPQRRVCRHPACTAARPGACADRPSRWPTPPERLRQLHKRGPQLHSQPLQHQGRRICLQGFQVGPANAGCCMQLSMVAFVWHLHVCRGHRYGREQQSQQRMPQQKGWAWTHSAASGPATAPRAPSLRSPPAPASRQAPLHPPAPKPAPLRSAGCTRPPAGNVH